MCTYSVAAVDLECFTTPVSDGDSCRQKLPMNVETSHVQGEVAISVQNTALIHHLDAGLVPSKAPIFDLDKFDSENAFFKAYVDFFLFRQSSMQAVKERMCEPIFNQLNAYHKAHKDFNKAKDVESGQSERAWNSSIFGQLESKLRKLCQKYIIFSFYGSVSSSTFKIFCTPSASH